MTRPPSPLAQLHALTWQMPFAHAVAGALLRAHPTLDFTSTILVLPGARAGRRIIALLADEAASRRIAILPPQICTPGHLADELIEFSAPSANDLACSSAWARSLMAMDEAQRAILFPRVPGRGDFAAWFRVSSVLEAARQELAGARLSFAEVAAKAERNAALGAAERWAAAAEAERVYLETLADAGLIDTQQARNEAIAAARVRPFRRIVLAGVTLMNGQLRGLVQAAASKGTAIDVLVYAPPEFLNRFDALGCVLPDAWSHAALPLDRAQVKFAQGPDDVARAVFRAIGEMDKPPRTDELTIGVLDEALVPFVQAEAAALGDIPVRYGVGTPLPHTRPYQLLSVAAGFIEVRRFRALQLLLRHPDLQRWLSERWKLTRKKGEPDWLSLLDTYASRYLPDRLAVSCAKPEGWRHTLEHEDEHDCEDLAWLFHEVCEFVGAAEDPSQTDTLSAWSHRMLSTLRHAYAGRPWDQSKAEELKVVQACYCLREKIGELYEHTIESEETAVTQAEAMRIALSLAAGGRAVPEFAGTEIDLVGWVELMPDDAPHLVIAGFSEGTVPESSRPDPFLNNSVRKALNLSDDGERYARDAYLLAAILESRPEKSVTLIAGRVSAQGDPLLPSRLLFAGDGEMIATRVKAFAAHKDQPPEPPLAYRVRPGARSGFGRVVIPPKDQIRVPTSLSVTSFRDYLASPQGFYLKHLHLDGLETLDPESPRELLVMDFGTLVHAIVREAMNADACGTIDSRRGWEDRLIDVLHRRVSQVYGDRLTASLQLQVALLEKRFERLAEWQHGWLRDGWKILQCEWSAPRAAALDVDGKPMNLRGRIDRIDIRESTGEIAVLDYKICTGDKRPERTHKSGGQWIDLQLPLYKTLAAEIIRSAGTGVLKLGFIRVADDPAHIGEALADWGEEDLLEAHDVAREVIRKIRAREFDEKGDSPPTDGIFAHIFGEGLLTTDAGEEDAE